MRALRTGAKGSARRAEGRSVAYAWGCVFDLMPSRYLSITCRTHQLLDSRLYVKVLICQQTMMQNTIQPGLRQSRAEIGVHFALGADGFTRVMHCPMTTPQTGFVWTARRTLPESEMHP